MRRTLTLLFIAFIVLSYSIQPTRAQDEAQPVISVQRKVDLRDSGIVLINDTYALEAPQGSESTINSLRVGFHVAFSPERLSFSFLKDGIWQSLNHSKADLGDPRFQGYELKLPTPIHLSSGKVLEIRALYIFIDRVSVITNAYYAGFPVYPAIEYNISSIVLSVYLPRDAIINRVESGVTFINSTDSGLFVLVHRAERLAPLQNINATVSYYPASDDLLFYCELLNKEVSVSSGVLRLRDAYVFVNMGASKSQFKIRLPGAAHDIQVTDSVGPLSTRIAIVEGNVTYTDVNVFTRTTFLPKNKLGVTIEYSLPSDAYVEGVGERYTLTLPASDSPYYIRNLTFEAILPEGGSLVASVASTPKPASVGQATALRQLVSIDLGSVFPWESSAVIVEYNWSILWAALRIIQWIVIAAGVVGSVYIIRKRKGRAKEEPARTQRDELEEFVVLYRERATLLSELEELERGFEAKRVSREQYDNKTANITRRTSEQLSVIRRLESQLEAKGPSISGRLNDLRAAEDELEKANTDLKNLEARLRAKRVSRKDFDERRRESLRRRSRALRRIEQAIAGLQSKA